MPNLFPSHSAGDVLPAADWNTLGNLAEASFGVVGPYIQTGLVPTAGSGLSVNVTAGNALIGANVVKAAGWTITSLTDATVNHLYLLQNGTGTSNTTGTQPANSVKLGTATTAGGVVTSVNTLRSSGRQVFVRPENQVPGAVGSPGSINLAGWAAAAADNVPVFGVLPSGAIPARGAGLSLCAGFTPSGTGADVAEVVVPFDPTNGTTVITWNVRRIDFRVGTAGGAPAITVEKSTGTGVFSATSVGTVTLGSGAFEGAVTASLGTVASGNKLRFNVGTLGTALNWSISVTLGA
jgi:hypothetical protein